MRSLRNILGERGEPLTILSLLPRQDVVRDDDAVEVPVSRLEDELCRIAGPDGRALSVLSIAEDGHLSSDRGQSLHEVAARLVALAQRRGSATAQIRFLRRDGWEADGEPGDAEVASAIERLFAEAQDGTDTVAVLSVVMRTPHPPT